MTKMTSSKKKFSLEKEEDNRLPFLDVLVTRRLIGSTQCIVFWLSIHVNITSKAIKSGTQRIQNALKQNSYLQHHKECSLLDKSTTSPKKCNFRTKSAHRRK